MRAALIALTTVGLALAPASGAAKSGPAPLATFAPLAGHRIAGFALDREWLAIAEDPALTPMLRAALAAFVSAIESR